jgi:hypothetical protein
MVIRSPWAERGPRVHKQREVAVLGPSGPGSHTRGLTLLRRRSAHLQVAPRVPVCDTHVLHLTTLGSLHDDHAPVRTPLDKPGQQIVYLSAEINDYVGVWGSVPQLP